MSPGFSPILFVAIIPALLLLAACDDYCRNRTEVLWEPALDEYRLEVTNNSQFMARISVDGEDLGAFCAGVENLAVGNFPRSACSRITVEYLDNPAALHLDDCDILPEECLTNNIQGKTCYNTLQVLKVVASVD